MRTLATVLSLALVATSFSARLRASESEQSSGSNPLVVVKNGRYGFIDQQGNFVIPAVFLWSEGFFKGLARTYICGRTVQIDSSGKVYSIKKAPNGELIGWKKYGKVGFVDSHGNFKIAPVFDDVLPFAEGLAAVKVGKTWGFVDESGRWVISPQFEAAYYFQDGSANVEIRDDSAIINRKGEVIYRGANFLATSEDGRIPVAKGEKDGFIDKDGKPAIPFIYDSTLGFSEGLAAVEIAGKWGYIDTNGKTVLPFRFDRADNFATGLAAVVAGQDSGFIDTSGHFVFHLEFLTSSGFAFSEPARFWTHDNRFGYVTRTGKVIWGPTTEQPDHYPLMGFSKEDEGESCKGIPENIKRQVLLMRKDEE